jgi:hypothetical protein
MFLGLLSHSGRRDEELKNQLFMSRHSIGIGISEPQKRVRREYDAATTLVSVSTKTWLLSVATSFLVRQVPSSQLQQPMP